MVGIRDTLLGIRAVPLYDILQLYHATSKIADSTKRGEFLGCIPGRKVELIREIECNGGLEFLLPLMEVKYDQPGAFNSYQAVRKHVYRLVRW